MQEPKPGSTRVRELDGWRYHQVRVGAKPGAEAYWWNIHVERVSSSRKSG